MERADLRRREAEPLPPSAAQALVARYGIGDPGRFLDVEAALGGLEVASLRLGLSSAREVLSAAGADPPHGALLVAAAPSDGQYRMDVDGTIYDDTDLELCVPVAASPLGLLEYWVVVMGGFRWSGSVHDHLCTIAPADPDAIAARLETSNRFAWGTDLAVWRSSAAAFCDARNGFVRRSASPVTTCAPSPDALAAALTTLCESGMAQQNPARRSGGRSVAAPAAGRGRAGCRRGEHFGPPCGGRWESVLRNGRAARKGLLPPRVTP